jgi:chemotaxis protein MotB
MDLGRFGVRLLLTGTLCLVWSGCVKKSTHQVALASLARAETDIGELRERVASLEAEGQTLRQQIRAEVSRRDSLRASLESSLATLQADRDRVDQRRQVASDRFDEARRLETLLSQRGTEYQSLQRRLESLRAVEREVRERNAIYEDVIARFRSLMDGGRLSVAIVRGRLVILLPQDVLFESGSAALGREGQSVISEVAAVLSEFPDRRFQVEGHTDNVPIATARFPSNWELSSARSLAVVRLLAQRGVPPENLSGAAYGEFQPVAPNEDREGRQLNRRIEIVMLPNLDVIAAAQLPGGG